MSGRPHLAAVQIFVWLWVSSSLNHLGNAAAVPSGGLAEGNALRSSVPNPLHILSSEDMPDQTDIGPGNSSSGNVKRVNPYLIFVAVVVPVVAIGLVSAMCCCCRRRAAARRNAEHNEASSSKGVMVQIETSTDSPFQSKKTQSMITPFPPTLSPRSPVKSPFSPITPTVASHRLKVAASKSPFAEEDPFSDPREEDLAETNTIDMFDSISNLETASGHGAQPSAHIPEPIQTEMNQAYAMKNMMEELNRVKAELAQLRAVQSIQHGHGHGVIMNERRLSSETAPPQYVD